MQKMSFSSGGLLAGMLIVLALAMPQEAVSATISCSNGASGCHFPNNMIKDGTARDTPDGRFLGTHARHSGYSTSSAKREYNYACTKCHPSSAYTNSHQSGFKNITGSSLPKSKYSAGAGVNGRIANTNTPAFGNCTVYCHSSGRSNTSMPLAQQAQYSSIRWGGTEGCFGCHGGKNGNVRVRSVGNFTLTTTHSQHLKYPSANISCQMCHSKTATDNVTLKSYTAATHHANGVRDVTFSTAAGYGSYTSYKSTETGSSGTSRTCNNVSCHGGKSRGPWVNNATNNNHTCVHCHGVDGQTVLRADFYNSAPGWVAGSTGTSTDQISVNTDKRVGAHFVHLSSVYMKKLKCNECHIVPSATDPFSVSSHMGAQTRYNSQTLTFAQASTAIKNTTTPAFTVGTSGVAAVCSTTFCHGGKMPKNDTSGTNRSVNWDQAAIMTGSPGADCGTCHGNPPTAGTSASKHTGKTATSSCVECHDMVVDVTGKIVNKTLHMNGSINVTTDCNGCHKYDTTGTNAWLNSSGTDLAHYKHIAFIKTRLSYGNLAIVSQTFGTSAENVAVCGTCHTTTESLHNNGTRNVTFASGGTYPNTMGGGTGNSMSLLFGASSPVANIITTGSNVTCSNLICHYATTPNWY